MSLLAFLGLRQPKYRTPLTLADVLHRTLVSGLAALSIYGIYLGYSVHDHVMTKGKGALALRETEVKAREEAQVTSTFIARIRSDREGKAAEEAREQSLAEAAQAVLLKRS